MSRSSDFLRVHLLLASNVSASPASPRSGGRRKHPGNTGLSETPNSRALVAIVLVGFLSLLGCTRKPPTATKEILVPDGAPPVLTSAERTAREMQPPPNAALRELGRIAQATYQQPAESSRLAIKPFEQWTDQDAAEVALGRIGASAVPALLDTLHSSDPTVRRKAVEVLGRMGEDAAPAVPALTSLLDDPDPAVRKAAARTLGQIGPQAKDAVPALMRNLFEHSSPQPTPDQPAPLQAIPAQPQPQ
jgi:hypothetical protein